MDGGAVWNINLASAVHRCREVVDDYSKIVIDVVDCFSYTKGEWVDRNNAYSNYLRFYEIQKWFNGIEDVFGFAEAFPNITIRHYVSPSQSLGGTLDMLNGDNATVTWPMQLIGREDGANAVKHGEGFMMNKIKEWLANEDLRRSYGEQIGRYAADILEEQKK